MEGQAERLERVRAALERAEHATGLHPVDWGRAPATSPEQPVRPDEKTRSIQPADASWLTVQDALAPLLPHGAIRRGSTLEVLGSTSLMLHLMAALSLEGLLVCSRLPASPWSRSRLACRDRPGPLRPSARPRAGRR